MNAFPGTGVVTPEAVPLEFEPAGIGSRFLALLIDWLVQGALLFACLFAAGLLLTGVEFGGAAAGIAVFFLVFLVIWGYPVGMETLWRGRSLGKAAMGLRVVTKEGAPVRFRHAAIRATLGLVDFLLTSGAAAVFTVLLTRDNQRLGDLVAGTLVLRERTGVRAPAPVTFPVPYGLEAFAATLDTAGLTPDDYAAVRSFLLRSATLPPPVRADLATQLATTVVHRLHIGTPSGMGPEQFLLCVAAVHQRRQWATAPAAPMPPPLPVAPPPPPVAATTPSDTGPFAPPG